MHMFRILVGDDTEGQSEMKREGTVQDFSFLCEFCCFKKPGQVWFFFVVSEDSKDEPIDLTIKTLKQEEKKKRHKITVNLPSIVRENSLIHKHSPFTFIDKDLKAALKPNSTLEVR